MVEELIITNNMLKDIINWILNDNIVIFYTNFIYNINKVYHNCEENKIDNLHSLDYFNNIHIIFINFKYDKNLLLEDEWPYYIKDNKCNSCSKKCIDFINKNITKLKNISFFEIPNIYN